MCPPDSSSSDPTDAKPISSGEVETPRGGFMARPGLKAPPRHAVVVRGGEAPESDHIPVARPSLLPPPPSVSPESLGEKITLRAIPTPKAPPAGATEVAAQPQRPAAIVSPPALESVPPPSDAPVVASVTDGRSSRPPRSPRSARTSLTILAAALAGLLLGVVSVVTTVRVREASRSATPSDEVKRGVAAAPLPAPPHPRAPHSASSALPAMPLASARPSTAARDRPTDPAAPPEKPTAPRATSVKRSIF